MTNERADFRVKVRWERPMFATLFLLSSQLTSLLRPLRIEMERHTVALIQSQYQTLHESYFVCERRRKFWVWSGGSLYRPQANFERDQIRPSSKVGHWTEENRSFVNSLASRLSSLNSCLFRIFALKLQLQVYSCLLRTSCALNVATCHSGRSLATPIISAPSQRAMPAMHYI